MKNKKNKKRIKIITMEKFFEVYEWDSLTIFAVIRTQKFQFYKKKIFFTSLNYSIKPKNTVI